MRRYLPFAALLLLAGCSQPVEGDPSPNAVAKVPNTYAPDALDGKVEAPTGTKITPSADTP
ncbi:hypothetical protein EON79_16605 [bacterium]|nr:MAG: hypothetical protein EON79_16605 [bacterium]